MNKDKVMTCYDLPEQPDLTTTYRLLPKNSDEEYYKERTDRNIGWITEEEQGTLRDSVIGVAGCGGMGGQLAEKFLRLGIGEIRIADCEVFDASNINRQFAATRSSIGKSKAFETAKLMREITDDSVVVVYPEGICENTAHCFISGCSVICDEIELWCLGSRILLHQTARQLGVPVFVCNTVGFGSHLFLFTDKSATMEECLEMDLEEAFYLQTQIASKKASQDERFRAMTAITKGLFFEWPEYCNTESSVKNKTFTEERLMKEGKGAIIATNPPLACGLAGDQVVLHLLKDSPTGRSVLRVPEMPGYLYLDAAKMEAKIARKKWW